MGGLKVTKGIIFRRANGGYNWHILREGERKALCGFEPKNRRVHGRHMADRGYWANEATEEQMNELQRGQGWKCEECLMRLVAAKTKAEKKEHDDKFKALLSTDPKLKKVVPKSLWRHKRNNRIAEVVSATPALSAEKSKVDYRYKLPPLTEPQGARVKRPFTRGASVSLKDFYKTFKPLE